MGKEPRLADAIRIIQEAAKRECGLCASGYPLHIDHDNVLCHYNDSAMHAYPFEPDSPECTSCVLDEAIRCGIIPTSPSADPSKVGRGTRPRNTDG